MGDAFPAVFFFVLIVLAIAFHISYENKAKDSIKNNLKGKGCQEIEVTRVWALGRRELSYDVKYRNQQGQLVVNSCIVTGLFSPGEIFWKNPL